MKEIACFLLLSLALFVLGEHDNPNRPPALGFEFTETLEGFQTLSNSTCHPHNNETCFINAYNAGKESGSKVKFHLHCVIPNITEFVEGENHICVPTGTIYVDGLTSMINGASVGSQATINVFPGGIQNDTLYLEYFLPFVGHDGNEYYLTGTKFIYSDNCLHVISMSSTLYITIATGNVVGEGTVYSIGMIDMSDIGIASFLLSLGVVGNGTDAQDVITWAEFFGFIGLNIGQLCFTDANYRNNFWYIWASDGTHGFLLDMIQHPTQLELRLDLYNNNATSNNAVVYREYFPLSEMHSSAGNWLQIGPVTLKSDGCSGTVDNITIDVSFALSSRSNNFVPPIFENNLPFLVDLISHYGSLSAVSSVGPYYFDQGVPMVYTQYPIKYGINFDHWTMISAQLFDGTDLQVEVVAQEILGLWVGTGYVYYNGHEYPMDDPISPFSHTRWTQTGELVNGTRTFEVLLKHDELIGKNLDMTVICSAPEQKFALLDDEGRTQIMTTLLGQCLAIDNVSGSTFHSPSSTLLERKEKIPSSASSF